MSYLEDTLATQRVDDAILQAVRARRTELEDVLRNAVPAAGLPRFYYGGSYGKRTLIAAHFDLDVVVYFPHMTAPRQLYEAVERRLGAAGHTTVRHNVALRLQYVPGWHVDVVPGIALDAEYRSAELYASEFDAARRTSLKMHIDAARAGDRDVIRLLKLWRYRQKTPVGSFVLELAAAHALAGCAPAPLEDRFDRVLQFLAESYLDARLIDPANPDNVVSDDIPWPDKQATTDSAQRACHRRSWEDVVW